MNIKYSNGNSYCGGNSLIFIWGDPGAFKRVSEAEMMLKLRSKHDPEGPPKRERGDIYIVIGTIVGLIVGSALGAFGGPFGIVGGFIGGGIIGAIIGGLIKSLIKKRRGRTKTKEQKPF